MKDIEQIVKEVSGTMAMEGMHLKEEDKERIRICLSNKVGFEEMKKRIIEKHNFQRKGYIFELLTSLIPFLFQKYDDYEICCLVHPENIASKSLILLKKNI